MQIRAGSFLVCGGASGLGAATAERLCADGAHVVIADLNEVEGSATVARLGEDARFVRADVTSEVDVGVAVQLAVRTFGSLSGAVNCAGIAAGRRTLDKEGTPHPLDLFERVLKVNLVGSFNVARLAAAAMAVNPPGESGERGVIVLTASIAAWDGQIGQAAYAASKAGIVGMVLPMARDLAASGIRVAAIAPGIFDTPLLAGLPEAARTSLGQQVPFPSRLGRPQEFASLVTEIISNQMINGEVIRLDGALRMGPR
jgi:NAD(P)-dependent dehydrogenase (short-subunit alcohol dehydrogenase family)